MQENATMLASIDKILAKSAKKHTSKAVKKHKTSKQQQHIDNANKKNPARLANNFIAWTDYSHTHKIQQQQKTTLRRASWMRLSLSLSLSFSFSLELVPGHAHAHEQHHFKPTSSSSSCVFHSQRSQCLAGESSTHGRVEPCHRISLSQALFKLPPPRPNLNLIPIPITIWFSGRVF